MPKRCVAYLRVSTAEQAAEGHHSLDAQEILCRRYAESQQLELVEVLRDEGYSGLTTARPGLRRLLEYTSAHPPSRIDSILVQDTSRMGRDTTEYLLFRRQLRERGIELIAVTQPNIDGSPEGRLVDTILAGINQYQSEEKGRRVAIALQKKFEEGWWPGYAPLGYSHAVDDGRHFIISDPNRHHLLSLGFEEYATGRYVQEALCQFLSERGLRDRRGQFVSRTTMNAILANPFYWGLMRYKGQERIGKHEPVTDQLTWDRCQKVTAQHNAYAPRSRKHKFLLTGLVRCKSCGKFLTHSVVSRRNKRYYHCPSRAYCQEPYVDEDLLNSAVIEKIQAIRLTEPFIDRVVAKVSKKFASLWEVHAKERDALLRQKVAIEERRNSAEQKLLAGVVSDDAFRRLMPPIQAELAQLSFRIEELEVNRSLDTEALREILLFTRDLPAAISQASEALRRRYIEFFFKEIFTQDGKLLEAVPNEFFQPLLEDKLFEQAPLGSGDGTLIEHFVALLSTRGWAKELQMVRAMKAK